MNKLRVCLHILRALFGGGDDQKENYTHESKGASLRINKCENMRATGDYIGVKRIY